MTDEREALVRLQMSARGLHELYDAWLQLRNRTLAGRFVLHSIFAAGGESILWIVSDLLKPETPVLARAALLHWHRPAYLRETDIDARRRRIVTEAQRLRCLAGTAFPALVDLVHMPNPLVPREFAGAGIELEPFLVMELIPGQSVQQWLNDIHRTPSVRSGERTALAHKTATAVLDSFVMLRERDWLYTDLKPTNLMMSHDHHRDEIRILDAGSIVGIPNSGIAPTYSGAYLPPDFYAAIMRSAPCWPDQRFVLYTLGKTLHQILTGRQPIPGMDPEFTGEALSACDPAFVGLIRNLISGSYPDIRAARNAFEGLRIGD
jgi:serine/threonine protein kinase